MLQMIQISKNICNCQRLEKSMDKAGVTDVTDICLSFILREKESS
jgi:hypothetical protein